MNLSISLLNDIQISKLYHLNNMSLPDLTLIKNHLMDQRIKRQGILHLKPMIILTKTTYLNSN